MINITITNEKENRLLDRKELEIEAVYDGPTPKKQELIKEIVSLTKAKENLIKIKKIGQPFGSTRANISVYIYNNEDSLKKLEKEKKQEKKESLIEQKTEKKEEKPQEQPKEEKKE